MDLDKEELRATRLMNGAEQEEKEKKGDNKQWYFQIKTKKRLEFQEKCP